ncbi:hypothetical protein EX30DRAFT_334718 [Ascodesmis nigricans]|uniref:Rhodopsin domain-containing protein n=1 Tax=Ascodesmis nigricans TaxID=341454 RepID=A0A4S2MMC1_9PEZI|nr:hypothetical protein EX30DRAFT_334718 [Ascodesmis nigricans]
MVQHPPLTAYLSPAPPPRTYRDDHATLLASYWCAGICIAAFVFRLFGRYVRIEKLYVDDLLMAASVVPLAVRMVFVHLVLQWGTNNVDVDQLKDMYKDDERGLRADVGRRERGSGMVLGARVALAGYIFLQKYSITLFYSRLISQLYTRKYRLGLLYIRLFLLFSFITTLITIFATCTSTDITRVIPPPSPRCRTAFPPLLATAALSSTADIILVFAPLPTLLSRQLRIKWYRRLRIVISFSLSLGCAAVSAYRAYITITHHGAQQTRTMWASIELLTATFVANAVVINSFARDTGEKKVKFHPPTDLEREVILGQRRRRREEAGEKWARGKSWEMEDEEEEEDWGRGMGLGGGGVEMTEMRETASVSVAEWEEEEERRRRAGKRGSGESTWEMLERVGSERMGSVGGDMGVRRPEHVVLRDVGGLLGRGQIK